MLKFGEEYSDGVWQLSCPLCGDPHGLHIDDVFVLGREQEDGEIVRVHVTSQGAVDTPDGSLPGPQPRRRHSINLGGWCELCGKHFAIGFEQHKGMTHVSVSEVEVS